MLDRIVLINYKEALMIYTNRSPVRIVADESVRLFLEWFLEDSIIIQYDEFKSIADTRNEDTQKIKVA
jgi:hypothetical protein